MQYYFVYYSDTVFYRAKIRPAAKPSDVSFELFFGRQSESGKNGKEGRKRRNGLCLF